MRTRDFALRLPSSATARRDRIKSAVAQVFDDRTAPDRVRYLYSAEPLCPMPGDWIRVRALGSTTPRRSRVEFAMPLPEGDPPRAGEMVALAAWIGIKNAKLARGTRTARMELERLARGVGDLLEDPDIEIGPVHTHFFAKGGPAVGLSAGHVQWIGPLRDVEGLERAMTKGIGANRAYGYGLLDGRRMEEDG